VDAIVDKDVCLDDGLVDSRSRASLYNCFAQSQARRNSQYH
jgi:hypothetical protein